MNRKDLEEIYYLNREVNLWEQRLAELRGKSPVGSPALDGMPRASANESKTEREAVAAADIEQIISGLLAEIQQKRVEVMKFINSVEDSQMRQILECRCISLMSWWQVAEKLGGENNAGNVRLRYKRFIDNYFPKEQEEINET